MKYSLLPNVIYGQCTDKGIREENQDSIMVYEGENILSFILADGVGGHKYGRECSQITCKAMRDEIESVEDFSLDFFTEVLKKKYSQINKHFYDFSQELGEIVATTLSMINILGESYILTNVGDTKIFIIRDGVLRTISELHTVADEEFLSNQINYEQYLNHPKKHVLTKAIGAEEYIIPYVSIGELKDDDVIIICSDGVYNYLEEKELLELFLPNKLDSQECLNIQCSKAIHKAFANNSNDNLSIVAIYVVNL